METIAWNDAFADFLNGLSGRQPKTKAFYACQLRQLIAWALEQELSLQAFKARHYRQYAAYRSKIVSVQTQHHDGRCAKVFAKFCLNQGYIEADFLRDYEVPNPPDAIVKAPSAKELECLLRAIQNRWDVRTNPSIRTQDKTKRHFYRVRDYAIVAVLIETGCRISEACGLLMGNFRPDILQVTFIGTKTKKNHEVPISSALVNAVQPWLTLRDRIEEKKQCDRENNREERCGDTLFLTLEGNQVDPPSFAKAWNKYIAFAGLEHFTRHGVRHYTITSMVAENPRAAQLLAGHADISTTMRYDHTGLEKVRADHSKVAPLGSVLVNKRSQAQKMAKRKRVI